MEPKWWWWPMALEKSFLSPARIWPSYLTSSGFSSSLSRLSCSYSTMQHIHQVSQYLQSNLSCRYSSSLKYSCLSNCSIFITHFIIDANFFSRFTFWANSTNFALKNNRCIIFFADIEHNLNQPRMEILIFRWSPWLSLGTGPMRFRWVADVLMVDKCRSIDFSPLFSLQAGGSNFVQIWFQIELVIPSTIFV